MKLRIFNRPIAARLDDTSDPVRFPSDFAAYPMGGIAPATLDLTNARRR